MPLHWNLTNIKDYENVCYVDTDDGRRMAGATETLIMMLISAKIGEITEANAPEVFARIAFCEKMDGPFMLDGEGNGVHFTPEMIHAHIGLQINVEDETTAAFLGGFKRDLSASRDQYKQAIRETALI